MNLWLWRVIISSEQRGPAWATVERLRQHPVFSRARFDVYLPHRDAQQLVICLGQMHTVLSGRGMWWWTARRIGRVQARLFTYFFALRHELGLGAFGLEGLTRDGDREPFHVRFDTHARLTDAETCELRLGDIDVARRVLGRAAREWHAALRAVTPIAEVARRAGLVAGSRLLAAVDPAVTWYPVESEVAHGAVWSAVQRLERELVRAEVVPAFLAARAKGFKKLNQAEYDAAVHYQDISTSLGKVLRGNGERERASLLLAAEEAQRSGIAVFLMGQAHRWQYRRLAPRLLGPKNIGFVFITPPELWWWGAVLRWLVIFSFVAVTAIFLLTHL